MGDASPAAKPQRVQPPAKAPSAPKARPWPGRPSERPADDVGLLEVEVVGDGFAHGPTQRLVLDVAEHSPDALLGDRANLVGHDDRVERLPGSAAGQEDLSRVESA